MKDCEMLVWMQDDEVDLTETRNNDGIPKFVEEWAPTPLGECSFTGEKIVYYRIDLER